MQALKDAIDAASSPQLLTVAVVLVLFLAIRFRHLTVQPISILILMLPVAGFLFSLTDPNFRSVVTKPDNVPIVMMVGLVIFLTWYAMRLAVRNDQVLAQGKPLPEEMAGREKVLVWPDLVYIELIASVLFTVLLVAWSIWLKAPLEEPANPALAPNPSKAPWYFLGLQEMLVYFDPWIAGVFLPGLIIVGLMAVPYIDPNPKGNGYYTFRERPFAVTGLPLRVRRPLGVPHLHRDLPPRAQLELLRPLRILGRAQARAAGQHQPLRVHLGEGAPHRAPVELARPRVSGALARDRLLRRVSRPPRQDRLPAHVPRRWGSIRYNVMAFLLLNMMAMPIKMFLRWTLNLKYIVAIPEFFFNI